MESKENQLIVKEVKDLAHFLAGDMTILTEVLHPKNESVSIPYSLAFAKLEKGQSSLPHKLGNDELYIFIKGYGSIIIESEVVSVKEGTVVFVPKHKMQHVNNEGSESLCFYCVVSPPWEEGKEEVLK